jgi:hypothetical protein
MWEWWKCFLKYMLHMSFCTLSGPYVGPTGQKPSGQTKKPFFKFKFFSSLRLFFSHYGWASIQFSTKRRVVSELLVGLFFRVKVRLEEWDGIKINPTEILKRANKFENRKNLLMGAKSGFPRCWREKCTWTVCAVNTIQIRMVS